MFQAEALTKPQRGIFEISDFGIELLNKHPDKLTEAELRETPGFKKWIERINEKSANNVTESDATPQGLSPEENIEIAISAIEENVASAVISRLQSMTPLFFEKAVLELLNAMGYGADEDSIEHTGKPGDEGIDGVINQDKHGLQRVYVQAKRYKTGNNISQETLQAFVGALHGKGATSGVFITTSAFTKNAIEYAKHQNNPRLIIIDGPELGKLLVEYEIGVEVKKSFKLVEVDENYFE